LAKGLSELVTKPEDRMSELSRQRSRGPLALGDMLIRFHLAGLAARSQPEEDS